MAETRVLRQLGGSFAPKLTPEKLSEYKTLAESAPEKSRGFMRQLAKMLEVFWETPESKEKPVANRHNTHAIIPLEKAEVERIWDYVPWQEELDMMDKVFDEELPAPVITPLKGAEIFADDFYTDEKLAEMRAAADHPIYTKKEANAIRTAFFLDHPAVLHRFNLRTAAKHLLWYATELTKDREPVTKEDLSRMRTALASV